uniref:Glyco_hydro_88 n=1 Tax=uncultured Xylanimonas sp. TaxID=876087 RepID=A0A060C416_9MICO|nr:Glyco_hydro_88 [uncultured Xylanimonas sp.]
MSMTDALEYIPESIEGRKEICNNLNELLFAVEKMADDSTNLWYQITDEGTRPLNYMEASGSLMILNSIAKSIRMGYIDENYWLPILKKGWENALINFIP